MRTRSYTERNEIAVYLAYLLFLSWSAKALIEANKLTHNLVTCLFPETCEQVEGTQIA